MAQEINNEKREEIARGLAEKFAGWSGWDGSSIATPNGNEPHEERKYWRDIVDYVLSNKS